MERHPTVLVTGADGQVGRALTAILPDVRAATKHDLDVTDADRVAEAVTGTDHVVHLAALTDVDRCEAEPDLAYEVNVRGTHNVVRAATSSRSRVILLSTDYVFDGRARRPYKEEDERGPLNVYGVTKAEAEDVVEETVGSLTMRSSWIFGEGRNFVSTILAAARAGSDLRVVDDQRGLPTAADAVARAIAFAIDNRLEGILHVAGDGPDVSWAELAEITLGEAGIQARVAHISSEEHSRASKGSVGRRPSFSVLDLHKAMRIGVPLLDWRAGLKDYVERSP